MLMVMLGQKSDQSVHGTICSRVEVKSQLANASGSIWGILMTAGLRVEAPAHATTPRSQTQGAFPSMVEAFPTTIPPCSNLKTLVCDHAIHSVSSVNAMKSARSCENA